MEFAAIIAWIALSAAVASLAERKGRSFELFLSLSVLLSPLVGLAAVWAVPATAKARIEAGQAWRCDGCDRLVTAAQGLCPHCQCRRPRGAVGVDVEAESWAWFYRVLAVIALGFGGLALIGFIIAWLRRSAV